MPQIVPPELFFANYIYFPILLVSLHFLNYSP